MAADQIVFDLARRKVQEQATLVIGASFKTRSTGVAVTPTSVRYRVDDLATGRALQDWASVSAASSVSITVTSTQNKIQSDYNQFETKQLTVASDYGTATQYLDTITWDVRNIRGLQ